jgi:hypothetical protein
MTTAIWVGSILGMGFVGCAADDWRAVALCIVAYLCGVAAAWSAFQ